MKKVFIVVGIIILAGAGWLLMRRGAVADLPVLVAPISNARARITKKPFGLYVSPKNSPVSSERFTGYHTGVDFETFANEQTADVPVYAVCTGTLMYTNRVSGYGGVAIELCILNGQPVTVLYGHLDFASIMSSVKDTPLAAGQKLAVLGKGYSTQTDGERKHLHLSIHKGTALELRGYMQNKNDLSAWLDFATLSW